MYLLTDVLSYIAYGQNNRITQHFIIDLTDKKSVRIILPEGLS